MKRFFLPLFIALSLTWIAYERTDGFSIQLISGPLVADKASPLTPEIRAILSQPFHYLNKGRQCFVFESEDGQYVLKFFNQKYLRLPWYAFFFEEKERAKRTLRRHFYENSYSIAYRELGEEILYLHLGPSESLAPLSLIDKASRIYTLSLTDLPFVLQKKGTPFYPELESTYQREGLPGLERGIDSYLAAISQRISKGICDADSDVEKNWGFVDGKIFHLDPGRLYYKDLSPLELKEEWHRSTRHFHKWLGVHYPEAAQYLLNQLNRYYSKSGESGDHLSSTIPDLNPTEQSVLQ